MRDLRYNAKYVYVYSGINQLIFSLFFFKLSGSILDVYTDEQGISPGNANLMNASCPSILPMKKEIAGNADFLKRFAL